MHMNSGSGGSGRIQYWWAEMCGKYKIIILYSYCIYFHSTRRLQRCFPKSWIQISKDITIFDSVHVVWHCSLIDLSL